MSEFIASVGKMPTARGCKLNASAIAARRACGFLQHSHCWRTHAFAASLLQLSRAPFAALLASNDKVVLYIGRLPLAGEISEPMTVEMFRTEMTAYLREHRRPGGAQTGRRQSQGWTAGPMLARRPSAAPPARPPAVGQDAAWGAGKPWSGRPSSSSTALNGASKVLGPHLEESKCREGDATALGSERQPADPQELEPPKRDPSAMDSPQNQQPGALQPGSAVKAALGPEVEARRALLRAKFRRAARRFVNLNRLAQMPAAANGSSYAPRAHREGGTEPGRPAVNWRAATLFAKNDRAMETLVKEQSDMYQYNGMRRGVLDDGLPCCVIHPESSPRLAWDVTMLGLVLFFGFMVPFRLGFDVELSSAEESFELAADVLFMVDLVANFRTAFTLDGILVTDGMAMARQYFFSWFWIDVIASFPIGWFVDSGGINKVLRMLRLFKLFRMLRLIKLFPRVSQLIEASIAFNPAVLRFLRSFAIMFLMWHNIGCAYWFVAREELNGLGSCPAELGGKPCFVNHCVCDFDDPEGSRVLLADTDPDWYDPYHQDQWVPHYALAAASVDQQYGQAVFWAVEVTTGIGGDIVPRSTLEVGFTAVMVIVGLTMYSLIIGAASSALANMDSMAVQRAQTLERVNSFMRSRNVPFFFQRIIGDYYEHLWQTPQSEAQVFADLPTSLRSRLAIVMNRDIVDRIPIFRLMPATVFLRTIQRLQSTTFLPGEFVIKQGADSEFLFFVQRGKCDALLPDTERTIFMTLFPGDVFGEQGMLVDESRCESHRAVDFLDVLMMGKMHFQELWVTCPEFVSELRRIAAVRRRRRVGFELQLLRRAQRASKSQRVPSSWHSRLFRGKRGPGGGETDVSVQEWVAGAARRANAAVAPEPTAILSSSSTFAQPVRKGVPATLSSSATLGSPVPHRTAHAVASSHGNAPSPTDGAALAKAVSDGKQEA